MLKAYKFRLYPNNNQKEYFTKTFGCTRFIYNQMLADRIKSYNENKDLDIKKIKYPTPAQYKKEFEWLKEVDSLALANAQMNLDKAYKNFFRDKSVGFPKFKSKRINYRSYTTNNQGGNIHIKGKYIKLPKIGYIKIKQHRKFSGKIKSATISKTPSNKYFVSILIEEEIQKLPKNDNKIGFDLGLKEFLIDTNGRHIDNPKTLYKHQNKLTKLQRELAHKKLGSSNWHKQRVKIAKEHEKITNIRKDFLHKLSNEIVKENQIIISEDLNVKGMVKNHKLAKSISDVSWSEFTRQIEYKSVWYGRTYHKIDRYYASSQLCSECGYKNTNTKDLGVREWICPNCGVKHDRDYNASINILNEGLKNLNIA